MLLYFLQTETVLTFLKQTQEPHDRKVDHVKVYKKIFFYLTDFKSIALLSL